MCCCCRSAARCRFDYQVEVDVTRFDVDTSGNAILDARWWVFGRDERAPAQRPLDDHRAEPSPATTRPPPRALSRALGAMSTEIAQAIADLAGHDRLDQPDGADCRLAAPIVHLRSR